MVGVWGASEWMNANGRNIQDTFFEKYGRAMPLISGEADNLSPIIVGQRLASIELKKHSFSVKFENGVCLSIDEDPSGRPLLEGTKKPRCFYPDEDLRSAVFISPTTEIWVT